MASLLIKGKCYDIKAMEFLADVQKRSRLMDSMQLTGVNFMSPETKDIRNIFLVRRKSLNVYDPQIIKESETKALLARYRYDIFVKRFGEMEVPA